MELRRRVGECLRKGEAFGLVVVGDHEKEDPDADQKEESQDDKDPRFFGDEFGHGGWCC